jgi:hypothetical protein
MKRVWLLLALALAGCGDNQSTPLERQPYVPADPSDVGRGADGDSLDPLTCVPNLDGQIDADELVEALGVPVSYLISQPGQERQVDLVGQVNDQGARVWDWSEDRADDRVLKVEAASIEGRWYEDSFPGASFVLPSDVDGALEAVYLRDEQALRLMGVASAQEEPPEGQTLLVYREPVALYRFPLAPGDEWVTTGEVSGGVLLGLPYAGRDVYEVKIDGAGELRLPDLTFTQALRVRQKVTLEPSVGRSVSTRQVSFLFECFGEVARATSRNDEPEEDFSVASELRRLGLE